MNAHELHSRYSRSRGGVLPHMGQRVEWKILGLLGSEGSATSLVFALVSAR